MCAQCDFSKHSGIFTLGNSHPLIVTLYSQWRSMMVFKKKKKKEGQDDKVWQKLCNIRRGECTEGRRGRQEGWRERDREGGRLVGPYPSHCSHVRPHLIGWFEVSFQEEDGRLDRPVRG